MLQVMELVIEWTRPRRRPKLQCSPSWSSRLLQPVAAFLFHQSAQAICAYLIRLVPLLNSGNYIYYCSKRAMFASSIEEGSSLKDWRRKKDQCSFHTPSVLSLALKSSITIVHVVLAMKVDSNSLQRSSASSLLLTFVGTWTWTLKVLITTTCRVRNRYKQKQEWSFLNLSLSYSTTSTDSASKFLPHRMLRLNFSA